MVGRTLGRWTGFAATLGLCFSAAEGQTIIIHPQPVQPVHPHPHPPRPHPHPPRPVPVPRPSRPMPPQRNTPLQVKTHKVETSIVDGVAVTRIEQVFFNPHPRVIEGTYVFPLDDDVAIGQFSMEVNGQEIEGKVLSVEEARQVYESIVTRMRDPALLEYLGTRMFRARIFPIDPHSEVRVRLSYTQMLRIEDGLVRYRYPLGTDRSLAVPIETVGVFVSIEGKTPIKSVFSPSHKVAISRPSDRRAGASYEGRNIVADRDFELYYTLSEKEFGLTVLTHRPSGEDGFFLVRIAPPVERHTNDVVPKDLTFVIDTSGSMSGEKIKQAKRSLKFCLDQLRAEDRFNVIPFSHEARPFRRTVVAATKETVQAAHEFVDGLTAIGGTNINDALLRALDGVIHLETDRPHQIVFLTDGQPTIGVTDPQEILENMSGRRDGRIRLYVFGVGYDVNTRLLDLLAEQNGGTRDYVEPGEDLELKLSSFYRKVSEPVLASLSLVMKNLNVHDLYPPKLGDLFAGSELVVVGRYQGEGGKAVELTGTRRGKLERFVDEATFPGESREHAFLPRLWATRKVAYLLDEMRLHGENKELRETIVQLATKYGIVTPYTAYLVTEPGSVAVAPGERRNVLREALAAIPLNGGRKKGIMVDAGLAMNRAAPAGTSTPAVARKARVRASTRMVKLGKVDAAEMASLINRLSDDLERKEGVSAPPMAKRVAGRTFYRIRDRWIDGAYDNNSETTKIELFSDEYFRLVHEHPDLAKCFALGERVVVVLDGTSYETVLAPEEPAK